MSSHPTQDILQQIGYTCTMYMYIQKSGGPEQEGILQTAVHVHVHVVMYMTHVHDT